MGRLHLRNIVFPAVLLSCSIFSTLTLPFVLSDPNPLTLKLPPFFEGEIESIFKSGNTTLTIRYIGAAIVLSVGAGLVTVEVLRRVQASDADDLASEPLLLLSEPDGAEFDRFSPSPLEDIDEVTPAAATYSPVAPPFALAQAESRAVGLLDEIAMSPSELSNTIPVLDEHGNTCRIKTSDEQTTFALMWNGEYYRFFRVRQTQEKALAIAKNLVRRGEQVVVSHLEQGYAVWVKEPGAFTELVT